MKRRSLTANRLVVAAILILLGPECTHAQRAHSSPQGEGARNSDRAAEERRVGQAMFEQYIAGSTLWNGERLNEYVNRLGQNLARAANSSETFTFRVVYSLGPNAEAFPGGFVVVNSRVISLSEREAEFASVIGHEIAHLNARHWQRHRNRLGVFSLLAMVPLMVGTGPLAWLAFYGAAAASPLAEARFSRSFENEADGLGMGYLARAGYDPEAAAALLEKDRVVQVRRGMGKCGLLSSHPSSASRAKRLRQTLIRMGKPDRVLVTTSEFESVREEVLAYDRVFSEIFGGNLSNGDRVPPRLQRRPVPAHPSRNEIVIPPNAE